MLGFARFPRAPLVGLLTGFLKQAFAFSVLDGQLPRPQGMLSYLNFSLSST